jgi:hypothetical protein
MITLNKEEKLNLDSELNNYPNYVKILFDNLLENYTWNPDGSFTRDQGVENKKEIHKKFFQNLNEVE